MDLNGISGDLPNDNPQGRRETRKKRLVGGIGEARVINAHWAVDSLLYRRIFAGSRHCDP
jgi:hypothetical protein